MMNEVYDCIQNRRSCRNFTDENVKKDDIIKLLIAAGWAPSGKNIQPWKFIVVENTDVIKKISLKAVYSRWMSKASCIILE